MKRWDKQDICLKCNCRKDFFGKRCYNAVWKNHPASCWDSRFYFQSVLQEDTTDSLDSLFKMVKEVEKS